MAIILIIPCIPFIYLYYIYLIFPYKQLLIIICNICINLLIIYIHKNNIKFKNELILFLWIISTYIILAFINIILKILTYPINIQSIIYIIEFYMSIHFYCYINYKFFIKPFVNNNVKSFITKHLDKYIYPYINKYLDDIYQIYMYNYINSDMIINNECCVCYDVTINIIKCNHVLCENCYIKIKQLNNKCPLCRCNLSS